MNLFNKSTLWAAMMGALAAPAAAHEVYLVACPFDQTMPDGANVRMWGYAQVDAADFGTACNQLTVTSPGPVITVPDDDPTLTVHLRNGLSVPTSLRIPGQQPASADHLPTWVDAGGAVTAVGARPAGDVSSRVRSFLAETPPGASRDYFWPALRPGTYPYQSATHPQVQVQMGLHGAVTKDAGPGEAYPGIPYSQQVLLLYSEVDPGLHAAVRDGTYGTAAYPSTIDYTPRYFLFNGNADSANAPAMAAGTPGQPTLLRLINLGLRTHTPVLHNADLELVAEDGNPYPYWRRQYSAMLAAGKSKDALFTPLADGQYPLTDRMLDASRGSAGGMVALLQVGAAPPSPTITAVTDSYATDEDTTLEVTAPGVLGNDTGPATSALLVTNVSHGTLSLNADGAFTYAPEPDFNGIDSFAYRASDGTEVSDTVLAEITVAPVNDPPVGVADGYAVNEGDSLAVAAPGVLGNDTDVDGGPLTAVLIGNATAGTLTLAADGSFTYTPDAGTASDSFSYAPFDGTDQGAAVTVSITVQPPVNHDPVAVDDDADTGLNVPVTIPVLANDSDPDGVGDLDPTSVAVTAAPSQGGTAIANADGTVTFTPARNFLGSDVFAYTVSDLAGAVSNEASVRVDVLRSLPGGAPSNSAPVAVDDFAETLVNQSAILSVLANDSDADGTLVPGSVQIVTAPSLGGTASANADGTVTYTPAADFTGTEVFTYRVNDDQGEPSNDASVTVNVLNAAPTPPPRVPPRGR